MEQSLNLFKQIYHQYHDIEICIAELKRKGFSQMDTVKVLMEIGKISILEADRVVSSSRAWKS